MIKIYPSNSLDISNDQNKGYSHDQSYSENYSNNYQTEEDIYKMQNNHNIQNNRKNLKNVNYVPKSNLENKSLNKIENENKKTIDDMMSSMMKDRKIISKFGDLFFEFVTNLVEDNIKKEEDKNKKRIQNKDFVPEEKNPYQNEDTSFTTPFISENNNVNSNEDHFRQNNSENTDFQRSNPNMNNNGPVPVPDFEPFQDTYQDRNQNRNAQLQTNINKAPNNIKSNYQNRIPSLNEKMLETPSENQNVDYNSNYFPNQYQNNLTNQNNSMHNINKPIPGNTQSSPKQNNQKPTFSNQNLDNYNTPNQTYTSEPIPEESQNTNDQGTYNEYKEDDNVDEIGDQIDHLIDKTDINISDPTPSDNNYINEEYQNDPNNGDDYQNDQMDIQEGHYETDSDYENSNLENQEDNNAADISPEYQDSPEVSSDFNFLNEEVYEEENTQAESKNLDNVNNYPPNDKDEEEPKNDNNSNNEQEVPNEEEDFVENDESDDYTTSRLQNKITNLFHLLRSDDVSYA